MIEAALMGGALPGPWFDWEFVGSTELLTNGLAPAEASFPTGIQPGDLVVALMSPRNESIGAKMTTPGWEHWTPGGLDYACTARYTQDLQPPRWVRDAGNALFVCILAYRAAGWTSISLKSHSSPANPVSIATRLQNELLLCIGLTPATTRGWAVTMSGAEPSVQVDRPLSPAMHVSSASVDFPRMVSGIAVDAVSGAERNLIFSVS